MAKAGYDKIAEEYKTSKQLPFRKYIEEYTLVSLAGRVEGLSILDMACGEGIYARKLKRLGTSGVLGVDLSPEMIRLAEAEEKVTNLGCEYLVCDAKDLAIDREFDLITGMYLLNYAQSREELHQFCQAVYKHLKPGGRFIGFNDNPHNQPRYYGSYRKYGFIKETPENRKEGDYIRYVMYNPDGTTFHFNNYYLLPETYEEVFRTVGFKEFSWEGPFLNPDETENNFWSAFMLQPPMIGFTAGK